MPLKKRFWKMNVLVALVVLMGGSDLFASGREAEARQLSRRLDSLERQFRGKVRRLSATQQAGLVAKRSSASKDSDGDGISDDFERALGSNICNSDTDNDGLDDRTEIRQGSKFSDADSDDDGVGDSSELQDKGLVSSLGSSRFILNGNEWTISDTTLFRKGVASDLAENVCVEVQGHLVSGVRTAQTVSFDDSCSLVTATPAPGSTPAGNEIEVKGLITSVGSGKFVLGGNQWAYMDSTDFRGGTRADLKRDACVEVKGRLAGGAMSATRITFDNSCL